jgi:hypothetical protein
VVTERRRQELTRDTAASYNVLKEFGRGHRNTPGKDASLFTT